MMSGQPQEWQTDVFRSSLVRKLEEAIRDSGNQTEKNAVDLEKQVCRVEHKYKVGIINGLIDLRSF